MERQAFLQHVAQAIDRVIGLTEAKLDRKFDREPHLRWWPSPQLITERVAEAITARTYLSEDQIKPCIDLGVFEISDDGHPILCALPSAHPPRAFGRNWRGGEGPLIYVIGAELLRGRTRIESATLAFVYLQTPPTESTAV